MHASNRTPDPDPRAGDPQLSAGNGHDHSDDHGSGAQAELDLTSPPAGEPKQP
jgi:hypothetical protein